MSTKTTPASKTEPTPKQPTFKQVYNLQNECHAVADELYTALRDAMPENLRGAFWSFASLRNVSLITANDTKQLTMWRGIKKAGKRDVRKLQRKAA